MVTGCGVAEDGVMESIWAVRRSTHDRKVSGLAGGLARVWHIDPLLVRIGFAILALSGGIGVVLYLAGWLMVPEEGRQTSYLDQAVPQSRNWSREAKFVIVGIACVIGLITLSSLAPFTAVAAIVVIAVWYFGYYRNRPGRQQDPNHTDPSQPTRSAQQAPITEEPTQFIKFGTEQTPFTEAAKAWQLRIGDYLEAVRSTAPNAAGHTSPSPTPPGSPTEQQPTADPYREAYFAHPDPVGLYTAEDPARTAVKLTDPRIAMRKRTSRRLGLVSLVVLGLSMTGLGIASTLGATISPASYLAVALLVIGLTLLAGTRFGRPPGMAFAAFVVAIAMLGALFSPQAVRMINNVGLEQLHYTSGATMKPADRLEAGNLSVDLRQLELDRSRTYSATVDSGRLEVFLPEDATVRVRGTVGDGGLQLPGEKIRWGSDLAMNWPAPPNASGPVLTVNLRVDEGHLEVHR
jgi:phage shock protein PspC (stress-responsive transcriptional regulator)